MSDRFRHDLTTLVREKLAADGLPREIPDRTAQGYGNDEPCSVCDRAVSGVEMEYEFETVIHGTLRFHHDCFIAWRAVVRGSRP